MSATMYPLRDGLPPLPPRMRKLPIESRGYCVPWFVAWLDGKPDFRVIDPEKFYLAITKKLCWLCGEPLGKFMTFVIGPMCGVNHTTSEPPNHKDCAEFAVRACPFMLLPRAQRRDANLPEKYNQPAGIHLDRNPGAMGLWTVHRYMPFRAGDGLLINIGDPVSVEWYCMGKPATRAAVLDSIDSGFHHLWSIAKADGINDMVMLENFYARLMPHLPAA